MSVEAPAFVDSPSFLDWLWSQGGIRLQRSRHFDRTPEPLPARAWDGVKGMLAGLAIGDALGRPTEGLSAGARRARFGEIRDYIGEGRGFPSDDTQLAFWTLEHLLEEGRLVPELLARKFAASRIFGIGKTVSSFVFQFREVTRPWYASGPASAGNGALMRIAPVLVPHFRRPTPALWADVALAAVMTHNDAASTSACVAFVDILWWLLGRDEAPEPDAWWRRYVEVARELEGETTYRSRHPALHYEGPLWRFVEEQLPLALERGWSVEQASESWFSGAYLLESLPLTLYTLMRHGHDAEEAIVRAVNDTRDNDTVGAVVGAAVGALHGKNALPERWLQGLSGRTRERDEGRVFELIEQAGERFGPP